MANWDNIKVTVSQFQGDPNNNTAPVLTAIGNKSGSENSNLSFSISATDAYSDTITYPGAWAISSEANLNIRRRAPLIGEHNQEIYERELGMTKEELAILKQSGVM